MSGSLSVVLPVLNAEQTLAKNLHNVLEVLSDLSARFEVLIVDQGSSDQTADVAHELAVTFPQLRVARRVREPSGPFELDGDLHQTTGEYVFVHQGHMPFNANDFRRLWELCLAKPDETLGSRTAGGTSRTPMLIPAVDEPPPDSAFMGLRCELGGIRALRRQT